MTVTATIYSNRIYPRSSWGERSTITGIEAAGSRAERVDCRRLKKCQLTCLPIAEMPDQIRRPFPRRATWNRSLIAWGALASPEAVEGMVVPTGELGTVLLEAEPAWVEVGVEWVEGAEWVGVEAEVVAAI